MAPLFLVIVFESTSGASKAAMKSSSGTSKYFQVLPSTSKARVWKVLLVLAQQYEACSGAWVETFRAQWVSGGRGLLTGHLFPSSFTNTNTQIHLWKCTKYRGVDFKHKYKYKWRQGIMRFYTIFSYLIQITPQSDNNNKIWAEIQIWAQIQIWTEIQTQSKEFGGCW